MDTTYETKFNYHFQIPRNGVVKDLAALSHISVKLLNHFKSTVGLNIHFVGCNFDFIGQPVVQKVRVNISSHDMCQGEFLLCPDNTVFCCLIKPEGKFIDTCKVFG